MSARRRNLPTYVNVQTRTVVVLQHVHVRGFCSVSVRLRACPGDNIEYGQQQMHNDYLTGRTRRGLEF